MNSRYYIDTSIALFALFGHSEAAARWLEEIDNDSSAELVSSRILRTVLTRALRREGLPVADRERLLIGVGIVPLTDGILQQAEAIVPHVKTLDAIHLASALSIGGAPVIVSHDANMIAVAAELGLDTFDPVA